MEYTFKLFKVDSSGGPDVFLREVTISKRTLVGKASDEVDLVLGHEKVSKKHVNFEVSRKKVVVVDNESDHGTFVNNKEIRSKEISPGDVVGIGPYKLEFIG